MLKDLINNRLCKGRVLLVKGGDNDIVGIGINCAAQALEPLVNGFPFIFRIFPLGTGKIPFHIHIELKVVISLCNMAIVYQAFEKRKPPVVFLWIGQKCGMYPENGRPLTKKFPLAW